MYTDKLKIILFLEVQIFDNTVNELKLTKHLYSK